MITEFIRISGLVQGVGYRPFVAERAQLYNIKGWVRNTQGIVTIMATGNPDDLLHFKAELAAGPIGSKVMKLEAEKSALRKFHDFVIEDSNLCPQPEIPYIPPDLPTCDKCAAELADVANRRYRHPFISCTSCGPRYSIIDGLPYDRCNTVMKDFNMCNECTHDYNGGMRHYAQTIGCHYCGPKLNWSVAGNSERGVINFDGRTDIDCIEKVVVHLQNGGIAAIKDIGGYHLTCLPDNSNAVNTLRELKAREGKPFAVMFHDVDTIREYCYVDLQEEQELLSKARPIVLLKHREDGRQFEHGVCVNSPEVGCMLPSNPVQIMLARALGNLVMTSANISGGLIITDNDLIEKWISERLERLDNRDICGILSHNRGIITPLDDSVVRMVAGRRQMIRRARGFVPEPVKAFVGAGIHAAGGDLKSVFCYTDEGRAYLSQQFGDLEEESCLKEYNKENIRMQKLFGFEPKINAVDLHPKYLSAQIAERADYRIQHHKAHIASVIAEHELRCNIIGIAFDGTGYGDDGNVWGSEFFIYNSEFHRVAHLKAVALLGGNEGSRNAESILYGYINSFSENTRNMLLNTEHVEIDRYELVSKAINCNINQIKSCSMGRLFDAVSAFLGICLYSSYEGEAAIELEYAASLSESFYPMTIKTIEGTELIGDTENLFIDIFNALEREIPVPQLARGFIIAIADWIISVCGRIIDKYNLSGVAIALSGGTFLNRILVEELAVKFAEKSLKWYINEQVPSGDGGLCLGQAFLAGKSLSDREDNLK